MPLPVENRKLCSFPFEMQNKTREMTLIFMFDFPISNFSSQVEQSVQIEHFVDLFGAKGKTRMLQK